MKRIISLLLVLILLAGCGSSPSEQPIVSPAPEQQPQENVQPEDASTENAAQNEAAQPAQTPVPLGTFSAETLTGETVTEAFFANADLTIINVWATYCGPCKVEMPILGQLDQELEQVQLLGIVTDAIDRNGQPDEAQIELAVEIMETSGCTYPSLILNESLAYLGFAGLSAVPATLFVDRDGNLVGQGFYGALDETGWRTIIAERLEMIGG